MPSTRLADVIVDSTASFDPTTRQLIIEVDSYVWDPVGLAWIKAVQAGSGTAVTPFRLISAATTNANNVKAAAGSVYGWSIGSVATVMRYVKLYNKATAPVVGTDIPFMTLPIPGNAGGAGSNMSIQGGIPFSLGIGIAITAGAADADASAVGAVEVILNLLYT